MPIPGDDILDGDGNVTTIGSDDGESLMNITSKDFAVMEKPTRVTRGFPGS
ncbi:MAG: hypothetical protein ACE5OP_07110 [Candidatus Glassbacteria bacterium]